LLNNDIERITRNTSRKKRGEENEIEVTDKNFAICAVRFHSGFLISESDVS
jgi:hypothetical protein